MTHRSTVLIMERFNRVRSSLGSFNSGAAVLLLFLLDYMADVPDGEGLAISSDEICRALGCSRTTLICWRRKLVEAGVLECVINTEEGTANTYRLIPQASHRRKRRVATPAEISEAPLSEISDTPPAEISNPSEISKPSHLNEYKEIRTSFLERKAEGSASDEGVDMPEEVSPAHSSHSVAEVPAAADEAEVSEEQFSLASERVRSALTSPDKARWRSRTLDKMGVRDPQLLMDCFVDHVQRRLMDAHLCANTLNDNLRWIASLTRIKLDAGEWKDVLKTPAEREAAKPKYLARLERRADGLYVVQCEGKEVIKVPDNTTPPPFPNSQWYCGRWA